MYFRTGSATSAKKIPAPSALAPDLDLWEDGLLPGRDLLRVLLLRLVQRPPRRHPQFFQDPAHAHQRQRDPELPVNQLGDHAAGPQREAERQLPRVVSHDQPVKLKLGHLPVAEPRLRAPRLFRPQRPGPGFPVGFSPVEYRRPRESGDIGQCVRRITPLNCLACGEPLVVCSFAPFRNYTLCASLKSRNL